MGAVCGPLYLFPEGFPLKIYTRADWDADSPQGYYGHTGSVDAIFAHHSVTPLVNDATEREFLRAVKHLQEIAFGRNFSDISYNFAIDNQGRIAVGRDWGRVGAHTAGYNSTAHGIVFIGNYQDRELSGAAIESFAFLCAHGRNKGKINKGYPIRPHSSVKATACPGNNVREKMNRIRNLAKSASGDFDTRKGAGADGIYVVGESGGRIPYFKSLLRTQDFGPDHWDDDASEVFGPRMETAVKKFQRASNLAVDGIIGPNTLDALKEEPRRKCWKSVGVKGDLIFPDAPSIESEWVSPGLDVIRRRIKKYSNPGDEYTFKVTGVRD